MGSRGENPTPALTVGRTRYADIAARRQKEKGRIMNLNQIGSYDDEMLDEYDFSNGVRGKYVNRFKSLLSATRSNKTIKFGHAHYKSKGFSQKVYSTPSPQSQKN